MPDMRLPIGYALSYPDRLNTAFGGIDWTAVPTLTFEPPDVDAFPCLSLGFEAGRLGGTAPAWLNAANEIAVDAFLSGTISWVAIPDVVAATLERHDRGAGGTVDEIVEADRLARECAAGFVRSMKTS
jgi:1-deoxy-D-xylulose-5-phosphate reductoisomerase